jgi:hypothetical protein
MHALAGLELRPRKAQPLDRRLVVIEDALEGSRERRLVNRPLQPRAKTLRVSFWPTISPRVPRRTQGSDWSVTSAEWSRGRGRLPKGLLDCSWFCECDHVRFESSNCRSPRGCTDLGWQAVARHSAQRAACGASLTCGVNTAGADPSCLSDASGFSYRRQPWSWPRWRSP